MPRELPILFNEAMVNRIQAGRKTQTIRPITLRDFGPSSTPGYSWSFRDKRGALNEYSTTELLSKVAPYRVGDKLYVREAWQVATNRTPGSLDAIVRYRDGTTRNVQMFPAKPLAPGLAFDRWRPGIHMPKWASRTWLTVTAVQVGRAPDKNLWFWVYTFQPDGR